MKVQAVWLEHLDSAEDASLPYSTVRDSGLPCLEAPGPNEAHLSCIRGWEKASSHRRWLAQSPGEHEGPPVTE